MPAPLHRQLYRNFRQIVAAVLVSLACVSTVGAQTITNLQQLTRTVSSGQPLSRDVDLTVTVCAASDRSTGVLIVQDETGVELLQLGRVPRDFFPGENFRLRRAACLLRKREMGVEISALPVVNNDGLHGLTNVTGTATLPAGKIPLRVEWFNYWRSFGLDVTWATANETPQWIATSNLWHAVVAASGQTNFLPGLHAEDYEGLWETLPDFNLIAPVKTGPVTNFDLNFRSRDEGVGIAYSGWLDVPSAGAYQFAVASDDGAALYLGDVQMPVVSLGHRAAPEPKSGKLMGTGLTNLDERCWTVVEGSVRFVSRVGKGARLDLGIGRLVTSVRVADATGLDLARLPESHVRIAGVGRAVMTLDQTLVLGKLSAASAQDVVFIDHSQGPGEMALPLTSVAQVQSLPIERAKQSVPVRIRGTVTGATKTSQEHWMTFQDDTRGIFVRLDAITNAAPAFGELWEVAGHSGAGDFAPIVVAEKASRLGEGLLPVPVNPTWTELLNGSRDVQWAELKGLVTDVRSNTISLYLPEGPLEVEFESLFEADLRPLLKANVRIRGVLYALWEAATREVRVGRVMMRNSTITVDVPAPADPFDTVVRTPRELLLFDAQASAFRPVKVRGQIVYADATQLFLEENGTGLRLLPVEPSLVRPGDLVEAVGYPDIGRTHLLLREVLLKKSGVAPLPPARRVDEVSLLPANLNSTRVQVEGKLLGWHTEEGAPVLEMQSGTALYLARMAPRKSAPLTLRPGSRLALTGVYVGRGHEQNSQNDHESFELLLNAPADIVILSQPSWWTLPRLLALVGVLLVILVFTMLWNAQLRRLVEQRTRQLQHETRERERVERQHELEAERARIARDLHDDLGSSLTEISVLASTGQLPQTSEASQPGLFHAIGAKARSLISALDVIVWAVDPDDNSLQSLADYLSGYTGEFFSHTAIACRFKVPVSFPPVRLEGRVRHELLMAVKEALNNVVRHARASEVEFRMAMTNDLLEIDIADNGKGIETVPAAGGHGIKNLSARLQKLGGSCVVQSRPAGGTTVKIQLPLPARAAMRNDAVIHGGPPQ